MANNDQGGIKQILTLNQFKITLYDQFIFDQYYK